MDNNLRSKLIASINNKNIPSGLKPYPRLSNDAIEPKRQSSVKESQSAKGAFVFFHSVAPKLDLDDIGPEPRKKTIDSTDLCEPFTDRKEYYLNAPSYRKSETGKNINLVGSNSPKKNPAKNFEKIFETQKNAKIQSIPSKDTKRSRELEIEVLSLEEFDTLLSQTNSVAPGPGYAQNKKNDSLSLYSSNVKSYEYDKPKDNYQELYLKQLEINQDYQNELVSTKLQLESLRNERKIAEEEYSKQITSLKLENLELSEKIKKCAPKKLFTSGSEQSKQSLLQEEIEIMKIKYSELSKKLIENADHLYEKNTEIKLITKQRSEIFKEFCKIKDEMAELKELREYVPFLLDLVHNLKYKTTVISGAKKEQGIEDQKPVLKFAKDIIFSNNETKSALVRLIQNSIKNLNKDNTIT